jgi:hypothetical protein
MGIFLGGPPPLGGYFGGKLFIFLYLATGCACKIFQPNDLVAKYRKEEG